MVSEGADCECDEQDQSAQLGDGCVKEKCWKSASMHVCVLVEQVKEQPCCKGKSGYDACIRSVGCAFLLAKVEKRNDTGRDCAENACESYIN